MSDPVTRFAVSLTTFALSILSSVYKSYIILLGYGWFILPLFPNMPVISLAQVFCLLSLFALFTVDVDKLMRDDAPKTDVETVIKRVVAYAILHLFLFAYYKLIWS